MRGPAVALLVLALPLSLASARAASAEDGDLAASTELFNAGRDLMRRGDYAAACPKLAESARLKATVGALAKLAECEEHERRLVSAYTRWKQALNLARSLEDERVADVERQLARLDALVPKVRIVAGAALPADTVIRVDDVSFSTAGLGVALPVELGRHVVAASAPHAKTWSTIVETRDAGAVASVTLPALEVVQEPPASPPVAMAATGTEGAGAARGSSSLAAGPSGVAPTLHTAGGWPAAGIAAAGTGLAVLVAGGVLGAYALKQRDQAHCAGTLCPDAASAGTLQSAKSSADVSTALLVGGGLLVAGGVAVWFLTRPERQSVQVAVVPLPGGAMIAAGWGAR